MSLNQDSYDLERKPDSRKLTLAEKEGERDRGGMTRFSLWCFILILTGRPPFTGAWKKNVITSFCSMLWAFRVWLCSHRLERWTRWLLWCENVKRVDEKRMAMKRSVDVWMESCFLWHTYVSVGMQTKTTSPWWLGRQHHFTSTSPKTLHHNIWLQLSRLSLSVGDENLYSYLCALFTSYVKPRKKDVLRWIISWQKWNENTTVKTDELLTH